MSLRTKQCIPCQGGVACLPREEIKELKKQISEHWQVEDNPTRLSIKYKFKDFKTPMELAIEIGQMAEDQWHHPELLLGFGHLSIEVWTHKINGLVESDFIFAAKVDEIYQKYAHA